MKREIGGTMLEIPKHVAFILDGNGRWAKKRLLPRNAGHVEGAKVVEQTLEDAWDLGIQYVTMYAFSTENWKRSQEEVGALMGLLRKYLMDCIERSAKNNMRVRVIGDISALDGDLQKKIINLEEKSKKNTGLQFSIALNYGGRDELRRAVTKIAKECREGIISPEEITESCINDHLDTRDLPDPDLMIRTSGEIRLSNFLPWQLAYTEFYFTEVLWPDFNKEELVKAIRYYNGKERRFGGVLS
ncbi:MAG: isoprenyl transferase [Lachnospiraceae bacterium]|nr:isoprenyl transferase [Lachnospiraceae bacterium]